MPKLKYTAHQIDLLLTGVFVGAVNPYHLPVHLYKATADVLLDALQKGIKQPVKNLNIYTGPDKQLLNHLRTNIYHFSAAKTFVQVLEFQSLMADAKNDLGKFKEKALKKWKNYNEDYLVTEYSTTITASNSAMVWDRAIHEKETFPRMRALVVIDAHTTPECYRMRDVVAPTDHPIWLHNMSPRHFNCRCGEELIDKYDDVKSTHGSKLNGIITQNDKTMAPQFKINPGKDKEIFKSKGAGKHPYFVVSSDYKKLAKNNFNLPIPDKK